MSELVTRILTGAALIVVALMAAVVGGYYFAVLVAAAATAMLYEWFRIVRGWGGGWKVAGFIYCLLPAIALLWMFLVTWATDIGGYFVGRRFGKRKLAPSISPGKTVEGLWGGVAAAAVFGAAWVVATDLNRALILLAPLFAIAAQGGDLFESKMKRQAGVKDSGDWLPGHGGVLDRLDGLVPVAVLTFAAQVLGLA